MKVFTVLAFSLALSSLSPAQSAEQIMSAVRQTAVLQGEQTLQGEIRKGNFPSSRSRPPSASSTLERFLSSSVSPLPLDPPLLAR